MPHMSELNSQAFENNLSLFRGFQNYFDTLKAICLYDLEKFNSIC
jgi:hypothetical protein